MDDDSGDYWCKNLLRCIFMDAYKDNIPEIFNLRHGGLGIVGGVTMAIIVLLIFAKVRKQSALLMLDTMTMGLLLWVRLWDDGELTLTEKLFGGYTNGPACHADSIKVFLNSMEEHLN